MARRWDSSCCLAIFINSLDSCLREYLCQFTAMTAVVGLTPIGNLVRGIRAAMEYEGAPFEVFNLGSGRPITVLEVVRSLEEVLGVKAQIEHFPVSAGEVSHTWANVEKAERLLGYIPKTPFCEGLIRFVESLNHASAP